MGLKNKTRAPKSLAAGRPPIIHQQKQKTISRKATKALINKHHLLEKRKQQAINNGDEKGEAVIDAEIKALGGLVRYQEASLQGQRHDRGGDSSRVLMQWLEPYLSSGKKAGNENEHERVSLRMLEVGALSTQNACSKSGYFDTIERIDLNSQGEGILQQDFMQRPLPADDSERFDIVSLSLVLNFVPEPKGRGEMLLRTTQFLHLPERYPGSSSPSSCFPSLFLVLPAPCVTNSRYLDEDKLQSIMASIGYQKTASKTTQRLVYYIWKKISACPEVVKPFPKKELRPGGFRNNFAVTLG
ncbi:putative methyltransferase-domain-containing protein [Apodospora peruviana]|uniref:25S rRNA adenine-N(1) methyltransferase n=1 Tax=Apodospora peruviana TaxID=516989 RepID=A0AAE0IC17_9PEZI|nr:putative methyltransferase-domain-containing protein [Apodospora peruviana]